MGDGIDGMASLRSVHFSDDSMFEHEVPPSLRDPESLAELDGVAVYWMVYTRDGEGPFRHKIPQPFSAEGMKEVKDQNVWNWDGDRDQPSLNDSFGWGQLDGGGWLIHLYLTDGEVEPCNDMALDVVPWDTISDHIRDPDPAGRED